MSQKRYGRSLPASLASILLMASVAILIVRHSAKVAEFSAVMKFTSVRKQVTHGPSTADNIIHVERLYHKDQMERSEWLERRPGNDGELKTTNKVILILITQPWQKVTWHLHPDRKTYEETRLPTKGQPYEKMKLVGHETLQGYFCEKREWVLYLGGAKCRTVTWWCPKLKHPLKSITESPSGTTQWHLENIKETKLPDSLFELPKGYRKIPVSKHM